jgi:hypothetical protein
MKRKPKTLRMAVELYLADVASLEATWESRNDKGNAAALGRVERRLSRNAKGAAVEPDGALKAFGLLREEYFDHLGEHESDFEDAMLVLADALQEYLQEERRKAAWALVLRRRNEGAGFGLTPQGSH